VLKPFLRCTVFLRGCIGNGRSPRSAGLFRISTGLGVEKPRVAVADLRRGGYSAKGQLFPFHAGGSRRFGIQRNFGTGEPEFLSAAAAKQFLRNCATRPDGFAGERAFVAFGKFDGVRRKWRSRPGFTT